MQRKNSPKIPAQWIYQSINVVLDMLVTSLITLNECNPAQLELYSHKFCFLKILK